MSRRPSTLSPGPRRVAASLLLVVAVAAPALAACSPGPRHQGGRARIVVTTSILGDVVEHLVGDRADVQVIMPPGAGPHEFQASARQIVAMRDADVLVVNGLGFEGGLGRAVGAARAAGVDVYDASSAIVPRRIGPTRSDSGDAGAVDPHFFTDPDAMATAAAGISAHLARRIPALATPAARTAATAYVARLRGLTTRIRAILAPIPPARRVLVTNHEVFGYFAARFGFHVVATVIPNLSTDAEPSARALDHLVATIRRQRVPAIFADTSSPSRLADRLARAGGPSVRVVLLYSEALGPVGSAGATYEAMLTTDAHRMAAALR